jgi:arylsulfatase A-like enzyme
MPIVESLRGGLPLRCLPHLLSEAGYRTAFLQTAPGGFENRPGLVRNLGYGHAAFGESLLRPGFERAGYLGLDEHAMIDPVLQWAGRGDGRPFFLTVLTVIPHHPYEVPGAESYLGESFEQYLETIRHQDRFVGELLRGLDRLGHAENTVVALFGDHGEAFGEHGRRQHDAVPYQEVVRVPLLLIGPERAIGPPRRIGGLRSLLDLAPTVLEVAGVRWRGELPGRSLLSTAGHQRVFSFCWFADFCGAMREGDRATVFHFGRRPTELYDLADDPLQARPVSGQASAAELAAAERRIAAMELSIDELWKSQPIPTGPQDWWRESP